MQTEKHINISVVGCGMWGRNIARNCASLGLLHSVVDTDPERSGEFAASFSCQAMDFEAVC
ncbi:MAG: gfo/Idh/MocA family oxidoreductase, partial [Pseudomonadota bacterium]|nr:gfo/Idh/MocA family oxidoreductase [Pseudomonadota bacterium]